MATPQTIQLALEKGAGRKRPTAHIAISGKPDLKVILRAQQALLQRLPEFEGFRLKACPGCHSGLERIVIDFGRPQLTTRFKNTIRVRAPELPQDPVPV
jgi:hypothetical protein